MIIFVAGPARATNPPELYDRFSQVEYLDSSKWRGAEGGSLLPPPQDQLRSIQLQQLRISSQAYGTGEGGLAFVDPEPVTHIGATVQIERTRVLPCPSGARGQVQLALGGRWFHSGAAGAGATNDIGAAVEVVRAGSAGGDTALTARCRVWRCRNSDCSDQVEVTAPRELGAIAEDESVELSIAWDSSRNRFTCRADGVAGTLSYSLSDSAPPAAPLKGLLTEHVACADPVQARSAIEAFVDDVEINAGAFATNDTCAGAPRITRPGTYYGTTAGFGDDYSGSCRPVSGPDAVFELVLTRRSSVLLSTYGSAFDTVLHVWRGSGCPGIELACNDDGTRRPASELSLILDPGTYRVIVDGRDPSERGDVALSVDATAIR